jgi:hypothetical protein
MPDDNNKSIDIGMEYLKGIYTNTDIETKEAQPIFILQRDTVRTFLHEKIEDLGLSARVLGYIGIEITLLAALVTTTFNDWLGLKGNVIEGVFIAFFVIIGILVVKDGVVLFKNKDKLTVDELTQDLGIRGSIIRPCNKQSSP